MGNHFICCQHEDNKTQMQIDRIMADDTIHYSKAGNANHDRLILQKNYDFDKVKLLQTFYKLRYAKKKFKKNNDFIQNILKRELMGGIVKNQNEILSHKGEIFSSELLAQGKICRFPDTEYYINNHKKWKYIFSLPPIYRGSDIYHGSWSLEKKYQGYGILYKPEGSKIEGLWENGVLHGLGRYFTPNREYFQGDFQRGSVSGVGEFVHSDGTIYHGQWHLDQPNGVGEEIFADGSHFKGIFLNGKKISGKFSWEDGSYYEGEVKNDVFHGKGVYQWSEGRRYEGEWVNGQMQGKGLFIYLNGSTYSGDFVSNQRNGEGKYTWNKDKFYVGKWANGKQHGMGKYYKNGKTYEGMWINGKLPPNNKIYFNSQNRTKKKSLENELSISHGASISDTNNEILNGIENKDKDKDKNEGETITFNAPFASHTRFYFSKK